MDEVSLQTVGRTLRGRSLSRLTVAAIRLLVPPTCLACSNPVADEGALCAACWNRLRLIERPFCERLGLPFAYEFGDNALSAEAIANPPPFQRLRAVAIYDGTARELVHGLKYRDHHELVPWMANWMARAGQEVLAGADLLVPVPLHWRRLWRRRFNQSAAIATVIARRVAVPAALDAVQRVKPTKNQVGLGRNARTENLRGVFQVTRECRSRIPGRHVVVVDDVYTTGATMTAMARVLKRAGAATVDALVFARVADGAV